MALFPKDRDLSTPLEEVVLEVRASDFQLRPEDVHMRLDAFLQRHLHWRSRASIQKLIGEGYVSVDPATPDRPRGSGRTAIERRSGKKLLHGSRVVIEIPEELRVRPPHPSPEAVEILYEDDEMLAVDKPPGTAVHPAGRHLSDTMIQRIHALWRDRFGDNTHFVKLCHRLDRETSGVLLCGKDAESHRRLMAQFEERQVEKEYLAICRGSPESEGGVVDFPLAPARASRVRLKMACAIDGLPSKTEWRVLERYADCTLILCRLHTGRQHQIRVHMEAIGLPLVGDKLYGVEDELFMRGADGELTAEDERRLGLARHALHNHRLVVTQPRTRERIEMVSELATDLREYLRDRLRT